MAKVVINNTDFTGFLSIYLNDYYNSDNTDKEHHARISNGVGGICIGDVNGVLAVELHLNHEVESFHFSYIEGDNIMQVDSINGVAPTSINDLRNKLIALL
jgi:hypothetical protein